AEPRMLFDNGHRIRPRGEAGAGQAVVGAFFLVKNPSRERRNQFLHMGGINHRHQGKEEKTNEGALQEESLTPHGYRKYDYDHRRTQNRGPGVSRVKQGAAQEEREKSTLPQTSSFR